MGVEVEFDVGRIGGQEVVVVVGVRKDLEVLEAVAPLLRSLCGGWVAKKKGDVDEANSKDGFCAFNVLAVVYESREGLM